MAVNLGDVKAWHIGRRGIGHAVAWYTSGWVGLVCDSAMPAPPPTSDRPERICRTCRKVLKGMQAVSTEPATK